MNNRYVYKNKICLILAYIIDFFGFLLFKPLSFFKKSSAEIAIKKILVIELAHIGDVLAITPALNLLRKRFPKSFISVVVASWGKDVLVGNPDINEILIYDASWFNRTSKSAFSFFNTFKFIGLLRSKKFDMGLDLRGDIRSIIMMNFSGIKKRVGYRFAGGAFMLTDIIPFDVARRQDKHQIGHNLDFIASINGGLPHYECDKSMKIFFSEQDTSFIDELLKHNGIRKKDLFVAIHPGAGLSIKCWPINNFSQLIDEILKRYAMKIVLIGGKHEMVYSQVLSLSGKRKVVDLIGDTSINQLAVLLKRAALFIGGDSGVMHIASAVKTPIIAIWGGHNKPSHWGPRSKKDIIVHRQVDCSPCGLKQCRKLKCLNSITVEDIIRAVDEQVVGFNRQIKTESKH
ncbi:MAG: glycosyltransferase family 9 protein [Candidatus Omnitrophica bacterium]|nr:glycosyltransferase family 9 protein [Candidatus Omnitrophota bacterium]MDD5429320.1 glycosyltransferase family 9 protein [Candidatus Omnitrophota bacterium]